MIVDGTVTRIIRRKSKAGSPFRTLDLDRGGASPVRLRYLKPLGQPDPVRGDRVTVEGMAMMGGKTNIGAVSITVHPGHE
jgi:hypothetical protein